MANPTFPLSVYLGPVFLEHHGSTYVARWLDPEEGQLRQAIDHKWNEWLERHCSLQNLMGLVPIFVPPEMLAVRPDWVRKAKDLQKAVLAR